MADALSITGQLQRLGFPDVLLWLLSFAIVFGIMSQTNLPNSRAARGIIAIGIASLVMLSAPANLIVFLSEASSGLILIVVAILVLVAFLEVSGLSKTSIEVWEIGKEGKLTGKKTSQPTTIYKKYSKFFVIAFVMIAIMIFLGAGGWQLLGFGNFTLKTMGSQSLVGIMFLAVVIIGVLWMILEKKD